MIMLKQPTPSDHGFYLFCSSGCYNSYRSQTKLKS